MGEVAAGMREIAGGTVGTGEAGECLVYEFDWLWVLASE